MKIWKQIEHQDVKYEGILVELWNITRDRGIILEVIMAANHSNVKSRTKGS